MVWPKLLLTSSLVLGLAVAIASNDVAFAANGSCSTAAAVAGLCTSAQTSNNSVDVWARSTTPGGSSSVVVPAGRNSTGTRSTKPTPYYATGTIAFNCLARQSTIASCRRTPAPPAPAPVAFAPVTLTDLANFVPQSASLTSQPRGWTVVNLNTNFIAGASTHVVGGSLFGQSAEVRFTRMHLTGTTGMEVLNQLLFLEHGGMLLDYASSLPLQQVTSMPVKEVSPLLFLFAMAWNTAWAGERGSQFPVKSPVLRPRRW